MSLSPGVRLGPYEIQRAIGAGGMGEVYEARDTRLQRMVAIKVLAPDIAADLGFRSRFEREARAVAALNHPNICALYDVGPNYLVMELVHGQPLTGPLPLERALVFARQILAALTAAHRQGITHRDLKPSNILVTAQGIKLVDFGLAKLGREEDGAASQGLTDASPDASTKARALTGEHMILGTVQYMSPEQAQGKSADARSDLFSFGLVLYEMLTGHRAFDGENPTSVIAAILERDAPSVAATAPRALDRVLQKCLAKDPDERWQAAQDVRHALDLVDEAPTGVGMFRSRRWALASGLLVGSIAAAALGTAMWAAWPRSEAPAQRLSFHLTRPAGAEFQFANAASGGSVISPDGRSVAFVAFSHGTSRLWIRTLDALPARELQDTEGARLPFWSPDSRSLGFFANGYLKRIEVAAGASAVLAPAPDPRGGAWNTNGTIIFTPLAGAALHRVSADASDGPPAPLTTLAKGESSHRWPHFLPDGRTFLYHSQGQGTNNAVYITTIDRPSDRKRLVDAQSQVTYFARPGDREGYLLWVVRDTVVAQPFDPVSREFTGSLVSVRGTEDVSSFSGTGRSSLSVSNDGTLLYQTGGSRYQLRWFSPDGTAMETVGATDQYVGLRLSPGGDEALVTIRDSAGKGDLWRVDLSRGGRRRVTSEGTGWYAVWSPDGAQIAFSTQGGGAPQKMSASGAGQAQRLWTSDSSVYPSDWSRDGHLTYTQVIRRPRTTSGGSR